MTTTVFFAFTLIAAIITFAISFVKGKDVIQIKVLIFAVIVLLNGVFCIISNFYVKAVHDKYCFFKSSVFFNLQISCAMLFTHAANYSVKESLQSLVYGLVENLILLIVIAALVAVHIKRKIEKGAYNNKKQIRAKPYSFTSTIGVITFVIAVGIGRENIMILLQVMLIALSASSILFFYNMAQLYYARKYDLMDCLANSAYFSKIVMN